MINSVNALEFLKPKLSTMDKYNSTTTTKLLPPSSLTQARTFVAISDHHQHSDGIDSHQEKQLQFLLNDEAKHQDRVKVQHLENHTKLQNNKCWNNFRTLYNISASSDVSGREMFQLSQTKDNEIDILNVKHLTSATITPLNIQNKSAFNLDLNTKYQNNNNNNNCTVGSNYNFKIDSTKIENNNNYRFCYNYGYMNKQSPTTSMIVMSTEPQPKATTIFQRTEYQDNAYRHIESVHNYAKSKLYDGADDDNTSPHGSRNSSYLDDDEDDDDDEEDNYDDDDDDNAGYGNNDNNDYENRLKSNVCKFSVDLDEDYEDIMSKKRYRRLEKLSTSHDGAVTTKTHNIMSNRVIISELRKPAHFINILKDQQMMTTKINNKKMGCSNEDEEIQIDIDVETVESPQSLSIIPVLDTNSLIANNEIADESATSIKPDHHARRPMNAFLIFCKRHRAIVKERYKNLENRAITKILGDWWASLDANDKKCFTNLAQQNKDAFFSANPNFKWYKLPAPPLRTLTTRPANAFGQEYQDNESNTPEIISNNTRFSNIHGNYFKLADEAQMGDLSQLMHVKSKTIKECADLQQVLGETSQFMSAHITGNSEALEENHLKRRFYNENSFSSNSSEDDVIEPNNKKARSCKGKRYQEFINSGQIATALKKSKSAARSLGGIGCDNPENITKQNFSNGSNNLNINRSQKPSLFESENMMSYEINGFDLEERIKELPALNLDDYLQRKRNTKKKKKFSSNGKKRGQRNNTNNNSSNKTTCINQISPVSNECFQQHQHLAKHHQQAAIAVGSQKRKARKESITRRDVSAIEHEVASLLPLTINGCCYFQEAPTAIKYVKSIKKDIEAQTAAPQRLNLTSTSSVIPLKQNSSSSVSIDLSENANISNIILNDNISSSTSDLLILAEVAANRTEIKH